MSSGNVYKDLSTWARDSVAQTEYQSSLQQAADSLSTTGCCTSLNDPCAPLSMSYISGLYDKACCSNQIQIQNASYTIKKLSDIIHFFGDCDVISCEYEQGYKTLPQLKIDCVYHFNGMTYVSPIEVQEQIKNMNYKKENNKMLNNNMIDSFNGMFGKLSSGMCRLSMDGGIAVKTTNGYKSYNTKTRRLVNCSNFVFDVGDDMFFIIPTNKVEIGDIIMVSGKPRYVIGKDKTTITVINYEDSTINTILPERHIFMGNTYFYGKIISMFGDDIANNGKKGTNKIMKFMMMSELMKGSGNGLQNNGISSLLPFMMMNNGGENLFAGIFDFGDDEAEAEEIEEDDPMKDLVIPKLAKETVTDEKWFDKDYAKD